ncbi:MAG: hypothetical protein Q8S73_32545 [Deltaproteobacteria bacterium]|nr:hypothetical protein [Myxococcales bacterium]MDP3218875.1 hypothetical protein [Deltaproteobacteria bacterium]
MSDRARDPLVAARELSLALASLAPAVPGIEVSVERPPSVALARFRLGQVPAQGWSPSLAFVGRRAVGKSSLALALAGFASTGGDLAASVSEVPGGGTVLAYDTPGLRAAGRPHLRAQLRDALAADPPDLLLAVFSVTEVDAGVDDDVEDLLALSRAWTPRRGPPPAIIAVLHRIDELPPFDLDPAPSDPDRALAIATATRVLRARLAPLDGLCPIVTTAVIGASLDPVAARSVHGHVRALLAQRLRTPRARAAAFERCLDGLRRAEGGEAYAQLRRGWQALDDRARMILLHPRGWAAETSGRSEPG